MKSLQRFLAGMFILLASSCVSNKPIIAIQSSAPSTLNTAMQKTIEDEVYEVFSRALGNQVKEVVLPDALGLTDSVVQQARSKKVKYITLISDGWSNAKEKKIDDRTLTTCTMGFRVQVFDVRWKMMILNSNMEGYGELWDKELPDPGKKVYPMSELSFPMKPSKPAVLKPSATEQAFESAMIKLRYTLWHVLK